jgi:hypothetical protein
MPGPNAIVAHVARIEPPVDKAGAAELLRHNPDGVTVHFEGDQSARILQGHVAAGLLDVLEQLRALRTPAYVEVRPDTREITRLLIPLVSRVAKVDEDANEGVQVELEASHARHVLKRESLDDGCWARAHEMCRLMIAAGASPKKVWIDGNLHTPTKNNPNCFVNWGWHVAPTLCVRLRWWRCEDMVIDPSLFTAPVSQAAWKGVQGDPNATLTPTAWTVYWRSYMPTDPGFVDTNYRLAYYRAQLQLRSLQPAGPPPYAFCP